MPRRLGSQDVIRILQKHGFFFASQSGSHAKYKNVQAESLSFHIRAKNFPSAPPAPSFANPASLRKISVSDFPRQPTPI
jgi:hypothetical protein